ncbi:hypothetical protein [Vibrio comitans]
MSTLFGFWLSILKFKELPDYYDTIGFVNPRMVNQIQSWIMAPTLYYALISKIRGNKKTLSLIILSLQISLIFILDARGLGVATFCGILLWVVVNKKYRKEISIILLKSTIIGILIKVILFAPFPSYVILGDIENLGFRTMTQDRITNWITTIEYMNFWGHGSDSFPCITNLTTPHNSILLVAFNWGGIAALVFCIWNIQVFIRFIQNNHSLKINTLCLTILIPMAYSLISGVIVYPLSQLLGLIGTATYFSLFLKDTGSLIKPRMYKYSQLIMASICILIISTSLLVIKERIDSNLNRASLDTIYSPQFWLEEKGEHCKEDTYKQLLKLGPHSND